jgi:hypothetical protein
VGFVFEGFPRQASENDNGCGKDAVVKIGVAVFEENDQYSD